MCKYNKDILFVSTAINEATYLKSAIHLSKFDSKTEVIGFIRNYYPIRDNNLTINVLGTITHGNYLKRIILLITSFFKIRNKGKDFYIIYCFSLDSLIIAKLAMLFCKRRWVYHIHDIRSILIGNHLLNRFVRFIEGWFLKKVDCLVVSSYAFYENHFQKYYNYPESKVFILENKIDIDPTHSNNIEFKSVGKYEIINIGYYGVLRCKRSWDILKKAVKEANGRMVLNVRGVYNQTISFLQDVGESQYINYDGPYKGFDDLNHMYQNFDIVWAAYPFGNNKPGNWLWARTVRFYEACAFNRPVIVQANTQQAIDVANYNIGLVVDMSNIELAVRQILSITPEMIHLWKNNLSKLDRSMFIYTNEYKQLYHTLYEISSSKSK